jgi:hypothetical protein
MDVKFNAGGRMVWDVATAVAWRIDPDRKLASKFVSDPHAQADVERVFVENADSIRTPPQLRNLVAELQKQFPEAITEIMQFIVAEHIYAAVNLRIAEALQDPERAPFLIIGKSAEAVYVDIDAMLTEYHDVTAKFFQFQRQQEESIKHVFRNSITPRFDKLELKLEQIGRKAEAISLKIDEGFSAAASATDMNNRFSDMNRRFDQVVEEIRKSKPPQP